MDRRVALLFLDILVLALLSACSGYDSPPGTTTGTLTVQMVQGPPSAIVAGGTAGIAATVLYDTKNGGVNWSCTPVGACGTFTPATTGYQVTTLYTAPTTGSPGAVTVPVTITATSVTDSTQTASASTTVQVASPALLNGQYAVVLNPGNGSFGMVASVILDGNGNIVSGEADGSANGLYWAAPSVTGTYTLDPTGHGNISMSLNSTTCCGTLQQTHGITAASGSHLVIAEDDQFNGLTIGAPGSMDLQSAGPNFSAAQVSGGYSFTLSGYSHANSANASWGGIFTADGTATIPSGIFDENFGGGTGYSSIPFTGSFTPPDSYGRGTITFSATTDTPTTSTQYVYYLVTPEVLRLTSMTNTGNAGNTGSAYGQGSVTTTDAALTGSFVFSDFGFTSDTNGGEAGAAAGQFTTDGAGNITAGTMDVNAFGTPSSIALAGSTYTIVSSPRGTITGPSGQTYNVYLTDPTLNLLDPNNTSGTGGALLLETDAANTIGVVLPQTDTTATPSGPYAVLLSNQNNLGGCCNYDGGYTGQFTVSTTTPGTFNGEGDFQGSGTNNATPIVGPLTGTFAADTTFPGRFVGTVSTSPFFPSASKVGDMTLGTISVSYYFANASQGFVIETDAFAPSFGVVEAQGTDPSAAVNQRGPVRPQSRAQHESAAPVSGTNKHPEVLRRSR